MLTINQMKSIIYYVRSKEDGDGVGRIITHPISTVFTNDERNFFQFMLTLPITTKYGNNPNATQVQKLIGWGHLDLIFKLKHGKVNLFIDCSF